MEVITCRNKKCINEKAILKMEQLSVPWLLNPAQKSFILLCCPDPMLTSHWFIAERRANNHMQSRFSRKDEWEKGREGAAKPIRGRRGLKFGLKVTPSYYTVIVALMRMSKTPSATTGVENKSVALRYSCDVTALHSVSAGSHLLNIPLTLTLRPQRDTVYTRIQQHNILTITMGNFQEHKQGGTKAAQGQSGLT